jgi:hypothetical protein
VADAVARSALGRPHVTGQLEERRLRAAQREGSNNGWDGEVRWFEGEEEEKREKKGRSKNMADEVVTRRVIGRARLGGGASLVLFFAFASDWHDDLLVGAGGGLDGVGGAEAAGSIGRTVGRLCAWARCTAAVAASASSTKTGATTPVLPMDYSIWHPMLRIIILSYSVSLFTSIFTILIYI